MPVREGRSRALPQPPAPSLHEDGRGAEPGLPVGPPRLGVSPWAAASRAGPTGPGAEGKLEAPNSETMRDFKAAAASERQPSASPAEGGALGPSTATCPWS